jgi:hypothetical protein
MPPLEVNQSGMTLEASYLMLAGASIRYAAERLVRIR